MAVINDPTVANNVTRVGELATGLTGALHTLLKPLPATTGHYAVSHRTVLVNNQAANSILFELRNNSAAALIVLLRLKIQWLQTGAHTAAIEDSIDVYRLTGFTVQDSVSSSTPTATIKRNGMTAAPGNARFTGLQAAGAAAGITGGTWTKSGGAILQLPQWLLAAQPTAGVVQPAVLEYKLDNFGQHPYVFLENEGFLIENRALLGAAAGSSVYIDAEWADVAAF